MAPHLIDVKPVAAAGIEVMRSNHLPNSSIVWRARTGNALLGGQPSLPAANGRGRERGGGGATRRREFVLRHPSWVAGLVTAAIVFFVLFRTGMYVASGDVAPLLTDGLQAELGWQWTHQTTGAGGPTYEIARTIEVVFVQIARFIGGTETLGQRLLFSTIWGGTAAAGAALASRFTVRTKLSVALGLMIVFNPYVLIAQPNPLPFVAIGIAAAMTTLCIDAARGEKLRVLRLSALMLPCSYLSLNPPLLALILILAAAEPFVVPFFTGSGFRGAARTGGLLLRALPLSIALAAWWAVPAFIAIRKADPTAIGAVTNVDAWSWTHRQSSMANVLTMFGHWSWPRQEYYGGAVAIEHFPWVVMRWVLPVGALLAPVVVPRVRRQAATVVAALILAAVFVGKGVHQPFAGANRFLYAHLPGFWLFREPAAKIGVVLLVLYVVGFALTIDALADRWDDGFIARILAGCVPNSVGRVGHALFIVVLTLPLVGVWPMWTGTIVKSTEFTSDRVRLPGVWHRVARRINESPLSGKTLVLPIDDYYQVPTTWGYYGADNLVRRLVTRPVIQSDPQLYVGDSDSFEALMRTVEQTIVNDNGQGTDSLLQVLGVSHVVVRKDIDFNSKKRKIDMRRPGPILAGLRNVAGLKKVMSTDVADVFELGAGSGQAVEVLGGIVQVGKIPPAGVALLRSAIPNGVALSTATKIPSLIAGRGIVRHGADRGPVDFGKGETWKVTRRYASAPSLRVRVGDNRVFAESPVDWKINGSSKLPLAAVDYTVPGLVVVMADGRYIDRWSESLVVRADAASSVTPWIASSGNSELSSLGSRSEVLDCNNHDNAPPSSLGFAVTHLTNVAGTGLELRAKRHSACVRFPINAVVPGKTFHIRVSTTSAIGTRPRTCVWMKGLQKCADLRAGVGSGSSESVRVWTVPKGVTGADIYLYADANGDATETVVRYDVVNVVEVRQGTPLHLWRPEVPSEPLVLKAGNQNVHALFRSASEPRIGRFGLIGDCNRDDESTMYQVGIATRNIGDGFGLMAREHSACRSASIDRLFPTLPYTVSFEHRTIRGEKARYCLLERSSGSCIAEGRIETSDPTWRQQRVSFDAPDADSKGLSLYLYADGAAPGSSVEYRNISISPFIDEYLALVSADITPRTPPAMTFRRISPARYRVQVTGVTAPFVLALSDSWSSDWKVTGASKDATIDHLKIDGYRNGWAIDARGDQDLLVEYVPARAGQLALRISMLVAVLTALGSIALYLYRGGKVFGRVLIPAH